MTSKLGLDPADWLVVEWGDTETRLQNKATGAIVAFAIN